MSSASTTDARDGLPWPARLELWDRALEGVRAHLRRSGLREATTATRVRAPAIEPHIEPVAAPPGYLVTSPEHGLKRLLARARRPVFEIAHVFRGGERGAVHREEFHLVEWYRLGDELAAVQADVEVMVTVASEVAREVLGRATAPPVRWRRRGVLEVLEAGGAPALRGDEDAPALQAALAGIDPELDAALSAARPAPAAPPSPEAWALAAWSAAFTWGADRVLPRLLRPREGLHLVDFPARLAALAQVEARGERRLSGRFESVAWGVELANGYRELRDAAEQRRRYAVAGDMRRAMGLPALPLDEGFVADVARLPACVGAACGLDRLLLGACGAASLDEITLHLGAP